MKTQKGRKAEIRTCKTPKRLKIDSIRLNAQSAAAGIEPVPDKPPLNE